ncbi:hypothetical protein G6F62_014850 [Rhizopus arrhizus]|nr:hypothetical protein G6F62_014850 [Rhizopus arrhizus]
MARLRVAAREFARSHGRDHRRAGAGRARRGAPVRHRRQRVHLLRPGRDRTQPGVHHRDGYRQPGDGHRQHRPRGRGREPAAWAEQRAGLVRHGFVPARTARLPAHL